jgi:hypothetical protein
VAGRREVSRYEEEEASEGFWRGFESFKCI